MSCGTCDAGEDCPIHGGDIELRSGSLFTGTAALDMAAVEVLGARPAWFCEYEPPTKKNPKPAQAAAKLLAHRFPEVPNLGDITAVDWDLVNLLSPIELLTAGWPCQPFSLAGKRKGAEDERALWPEVDRCVRALRPRYVLLENVPAVTGAELGRVGNTLAEIGYRFAWVCVSASSVGAPHKRERFFLLAALGDTAVRGRGVPSAARRGRESAGSVGGSGIAVADATRTGSQGVVASGSTSGVEPQAVTDAERDSRSPVADANRGGVREQPVSIAGSRGKAVAEQSRAVAASHADGDERERQPVQQRGETAVAGDSGRPDWVGFAPAIHRWEAILGRPAPVPTTLGPRGGRILNPALPEWMMGLPEGWITDIPGLSRAQQLKLAGNGVVKQQAVAAYRYLLDVLAQDARAAA